MGTFPKTKPKSEEALGYWWGGLSPSLSATTKESGGKTSHSFCKRLNKGQTNIRRRNKEAHDTLMIERR